MGKRLLVPNGLARRYWSRGADPFGPCQSLRAYIKAAGELEDQPTQHSVREHPRASGSSLICCFGRAEHPITRQAITPQHLRKFLCNVRFPIDGLIPALRRAFDLFGGRLQYHAKGSMPRCCAWFSGINRTRA